MRSHCSRALPLSRNASCTMRALSGAGRLPQLPSVGERDMTCRSPPRGRRGGSGIATVCRKLIAQQVTAALTMETVEATDPAESRARLFTGRRVTCTAAELLLHQRTPAEGAQWRVARA